MKNTLTVFLLLIILAIVGLSYFDVEPEGVLINPIEAVKAAIPTVSNPTAPVQPVNPTAPQDATQTPYVIVVTTTPVPCDEADGWLPNPDGNGCYRVVPTQTPLPALPNVPTLNDLNSALPTIEFSTQP